MAGEAEHVVQSDECAFTSPHTHTQLLCYSQVCLSSKLDCSQRRHPGATMRFNRSSPSNDARPSSTLVLHSPLHSKSNSSLIPASFFFCSFTTHLSQFIFPLLPARIFWYNTPHPPPPSSSNLPTWHRTLVPSSQAAWEKGRGPSERKGETKTGSNAWLPN